MLSLKEWVRRGALGMLLAATALLGGCASVYLDGTTKEVPVAQFKKPASPAPVQLFFDFQTKGGQRPGHGTAARPRDGAGQSQRLVQ